jgi:hypothetical protein
MRESVSKTPDGRLGYVAHEGLAVTVLAAATDTHNTQHTQRTSCTVTDIFFIHKTNNDSENTNTHSSTVLARGGGGGDDERG